MFSDLKLNIHIEPLDGLHMSDYDFICTFYVYKNKSITIQKKQMKMVDSDNYIVPLTGDMIRQIGKGHLRLMVKALIPDSDFDGDFRTEIVELCTNIAIQ